MAALIIINALGAGRVSFTSTYAADCDGRHSHRSPNYLFFGRCHETNLRSAGDGCKNVF
jgi:hypothetical protein